MSSEWWKRNLDKVVTAFFSIVVAGLIGFFVALMTVKDQIAATNTNLVKVQSTHDTQYTTVIEPLRTTVGNNVQILSQIRADFDSLQKLNAIAQQTHTALQLLAEVERSKTLREMRTLFDDLRVARDKEFRTLLEQVLKTVRDEAPQVRDQP